MRRTRPQLRQRKVCSSVRRVPTRRSESAASARVRSTIAPEILGKLRDICLRLPGAYEEQAWLGVRFMVRKRNFAHVVPISAGWPPAYARAADSPGPLVVLTFRTSATLRDVLRNAGPRFFVPAWGTLWGTKVVGLKLSPTTDYSEVAELLTQSHRLLAPRSGQAEPSQRRS
jgi:hypothetical protein